MQRIVRLDPWSLVAPRLPATGPLYLTAPRTFPARWSAVEISGGFRVEGANRLPLAYIYGHDDANADVLTLDGARRMAENFARLSELVQS
jgi:hypothetical protein